jgi:hypothetical protein
MSAVCARRKKPRNRQGPTMDWKILAVLGILFVVVVSGMVDAPIREGFTAPLRSDIGFARDGWKEDASYERDLRYREAFADVQGIGTASDFCRAVSRKGDPGSLHVACALGRRDGMDNMEYRSRTVREGFRFSRDDYWRVGTAGRMDYCRIVRDEMDGTWYSSCAVAGSDGFKKVEARDTNPPPAIRNLLEAYEDIAVWYRWFDDGLDYAANTEYETHCRTEIPALLNAEVSRGAQFNRWPLAAQEAGDIAPPLRDYVRWGEPGSLSLDQTVQPRQIRAISLWVHLDTLTGSPTVLECSAPNDSNNKRDLMWIGVEGGDAELPPVPPVEPAQEIRPQQALGLTHQTEPVRLPTHTKAAATWVFEIWDGEQRIMRLAAPAGNAKAHTWQHVAVTTVEDTKWWPTWQLWIDGRLVATKPEGRTHTAMELTHNYIGRDMRGCVQDFRVYTAPLPAPKIEAAVRAGKKRLHPQP